MSTDAPILRAFLSHSWADKALARRVARRLRHRGVTAWLDEAEMQVGNQIGERLTEEIRGSSHFLALVSSASARSKWVAKEISVARAATKSSGRTILPLLAEEGVALASLERWLGTSIVDPFDFEAGMDAVAKVILGLPAVVQVDRDRMLADLEAIAGETPAIAGFIRQLAAEGRISKAQSAALPFDEADRHSLEAALIVLHEVADTNSRELIASLAADYFRAGGVGYSVLRREIALDEPDSDSLRRVFLGLGDRFARTRDLDAALQLFERAERPQDTAFGSFVQANFDMLSNDERQRCVRYVVTPYRSPSRFTADAAYDLYVRMPESEALRALWWSWVHEYRFGGRVVGSEEVGEALTFYDLMNQARAGKLAQFEPLIDQFRQRFRDLAKSGKTPEAIRSVGLLHDAARAKYVDRQGLADELTRAVGSSEWESMEGGDRLRGPVAGLAADVIAGRPLDRAVEAIVKVLDTIPAL